MASRVFQSLGELGAYAQQTGIRLVDPGAPLFDATVGHDFGPVWDNQPSIRKVVSFIAGNLASIALHAFERVDDGDRRRISTGPLAMTLRRPSSAPAMTPFRFWEAVLIDGLLHDRWCLMKTRRDDGSLELTRIPARRVWFKPDALDRIAKVQIWTTEGYKELDPDGFILDVGYSQRGASGTSPMETLRALLEEAAEAVAYRRGVWKNGARVPAVLERDKPWSSDGAYERFKAGWQSFIRGGGNEGGTPILEDGMKLAKVEAFKPHDTDDLAGRQLADIEVASAYHIAPELVGARQGTYSNMDAYRQMLYRDNLAGYIAAWEQAVDAGIAPELSEGRDVYIEANLESKLRGSFIEQATVMQTAVGAPYMLREEARQRLNLPHIDGADELVVPLNVLIGGQASPTDSGSQNLGPKRQAEIRSKAVDAAGALRLLVKARHTENQAKKVAEILRKFFARQGAAVLSALGAGEQYWWDEQRWNDELTKDLHAVAASIAAVIGKAEAEALGFTADDYDPDMTVHYLQAVAKNYAESINLTTKDELDAAQGDEDADPADVFTKANDERADGVGGAVSRFVAGFATHEAARQIQKSHNVTMTKTWVTGSNPRSSHARMDGETVGIDETFSNGQKWPGGPGGGKDDVGCNCRMTTQMAPEEG